MIDNGLGPTAKVPATKKPVADMSAYENLGSVGNDLEYVRDSLELEALRKRVTPKIVIEEIKEAVSKGEKSFYIPLHIWIHPEDENYLALKAALLKNPTIQDVFLNDAWDNTGNKYVRKRGKYAFLNIKLVPLKRDNSLKPNNKKGNSWLDRFKSKAPELGSSTAISYQPLNDISSLLDDFKRNETYIKLNRRKLKGLKVDLRTLTKAIKEVEEVLKNPNSIKRIHPLTNALQHLETLSHSFEDHINLKPAQRTELDTLADNFELVTKLIHARVKETGATQEARVAHETSAHSIQLKLEML